MSEYFFTRSTKGKRMLCVAGNLYYENKKYKCNTYFVCEHSVSSGCPARAILKDGGRLVLKGEHSEHAVNQLMPDIREKVEILKDTAKRTDLSTNEIFVEFTSELTDNEIAIAPSENSLKTSIQRFRRKASNYPQLPADLSNWVFPSTLTHLNDGNGELFLKYNGCSDGNGILLFTTDQFLSELKNAKTWYMDGTFKVSPRNYIQLFTIHGFESKLSIPLIYALLPNKSYQTYEILFRKILDLVDHNSPEKIMTDYEQALFKASEEVFTNALHKGCYFHFKQALYRQVAQQGFSSLYNDRTNPLSVKLRTLASLSLVPEGMCTSMYYELKEKGYFPPEFLDLLDYMEKTWIGRRVDGMQRTGRFGHNSWNFNTEIRLDLPKTTNSVEGWHNDLNRMFRSEHLHLYSVIKILIKSQSKSSYLINQAELGVMLTKKSKKYNRINKRLKYLIKEWKPECDTQQYLESLNRFI